jgi:hypothetical protein
MLKRSKIIIKILIKYFLKPNIFLKLAQTQCHMQNRNKPKWKRLIKYTSSNKRLSFEIDLLACFAREIW